MLGEGVNALPSPAGVAQQAQLALVANMSADYKSNSTCLCWEREQEHCLHQQGSACCAKNKPNGPNRRCHEIRTKVGRAKTPVKLPKKTNTAQDAAVTEKYSNIHLCWEWERTHCLHQHRKTTTKGGCKLNKLLTDVTVVQMSGEGVSTLASPT